VVLHVSESFGGGVATAIISFAENSPWAAHHLLAGSRNDAKIDLTGDLPFESISILPKSYLKSIAAIRASYKHISPDIVHLHSSFAGAYGRVAGLTRRRIIYTPHGFSFERRGHPLKRAGTFLVEQALALGGRGIAAVSPRECALARRLLTAGEVSLLPNYAAIPEGFARSARRGAKRPLVGAMVGRFTAAKDPDFFLKTWEYLRARSDGVRLAWIGGGEPGLERKFRDAGIEVTGWLDRDQVLSRMRDLDFYIHSSAWEGNPLSILEAAALGLPIVARDIPALRSIGMSALAPTPEELAALAASLTEPGVMAGLLDQTAQLNRAYSRQAQVEALRRLYGAEDSDGRAAAPAAEE
jgi:glycosyltransferase involved in cell wall biosynthesis